MKNFLKRQDQFGHPVVLNFVGDIDDDPSDTYPTVIGGLFSILLKIIYYASFAYFAYRMFVRADNKVSTIISPVNWKDLASN